jgi:hypothetical protein
MYNKFVIVLFFIQFIRKSYSYGTNCKPPITSDPIYLKLKSQDKYAITWSNDLTSYTFNSDNHHTKYSTNTANAIMSKTCLICIGDSLMRRLCRHIETYLINKLPTEEELLRGKNENIEYVNAPCMFFVWSSSIHNVTTNIELKSIEQFMKRKHNTINNLDTFNVAFIYNVGVHHFKPQDTEQEAHTIHTMLNNKLPIILDSIYNMTIWSKIGKNSIIWRTPPPAAEKRIPPIRLAKWTEDSVNIIYNEAKRRDLRYFYNSGFHLYPQNHIVPISTTVSNSRNSNNRNIASLYILDSFTHVENVSYGKCRDKGNMDSHFGHKARSAMMQTLLWMLDDSIPKPSTSKL